MFLARVLGSFLHFSSTQSYLCKFSRENSGFHAAHQALLTAPAEDAKHILADRFPVGMPSTSRFLCGAFRLVPVFVLVGFPINEQQI